MPRYYFKEIVRYVVDAPSPQEAYDKASMEGWNDFFDGVLERWGYEVLPDGGIEDIDWDE